MAEECRALCDYDGADGELSFRKGEIITVLAKGTDSGFWEGCVQNGTGGSTRGLFPNCMVTSNLNIQRSAKVFVNKAVTLFDYTGRGEKEMSFHKHDLITAVKPSDLDGWWFGVNESQRKRDIIDASTSSSSSSSTATAASIKMIDSKLVNPNNSSDLAASFFDASNTNPEYIHSITNRYLKLFPTNFVTCNVVVAAYPFQGRQRHELSLSIGDVVMVHRKWNDGWWEGSLPVDPNGAPPPLALSGDAPIVVGGRRRGIFPANYTLPNVPSTTEHNHLFCPKCRSLLPSGKFVSAKCKECNKNEEIVLTMMRTLEEYTEELEEGGGGGGPGGGGEEEPHLDLFASIDMDPKKGPGSLLSNHDVKDHNQMVRPKSSEK